MVCGVLLHKRLEHMSVSVRKMSAKEVVKYKQNETLLYFYVGIYVIRQQTLSLFK
jgi:hypothetical protein